MLSADLNSTIHDVARWRFLSNYIIGLISNRQSRRRADEVAQRHYDIDNDVYRAMLDSTMCYSCGYWQHANNLEQAQQDKLGLICDKLQLQAGERLLDIGCGWGSLAHFAATGYGAQVGGITVSKEQLHLAQERRQGLPVTIELMDYRELDGRYDKIVSVRMFEHVGPKNYRTFFRKVCELLKPEGIFLLHNHRQLVY